MRKVIFTLILTILSSLVTMDTYGAHSLKYLQELKYQATVEQSFLIYLDRILVEEIVSEAQEYLGSRYVWGARGPYQFDCSGFTSYVFEQCGIRIPRTSREQAQEGDFVNPHDAQPGDLIFFSSRRSGRNRVGHVGMIVEVDEDTGEFTFIHASVKYGVTFQHFPDDGYYSAKFICIKRLI